MNKTWPTVAAAAALSFVALVAPAHAAAAASGTVGSWRATVTRPGATENITLDFYADGRVCLEVDGGKSPGWWHGTGHQTFNYKIKENMFDPSGNLLGWVKIDQDAVRSGTAFTSQGISRVYNPDGTLRDSVHVTVDATRQSGHPSGTPC
ncbi:hypothetical protein ACGFYV_23825 [Streptomyces sp. NPDC048297]|uniref:hypothetical protein n=1 Tax=Streptomyces sp. NPDC048297 TaxID=3365531 RepID=UPI0037201530